MTTGTEPATPAVLMALDVETAPDAAAVALAPPRTTSRRSGALHSINTAACLLMREGTDGGWAPPELVSIGAPAEEFDVLMSLDRSLRTLRLLDGELVTYNGLRHDVPTIRRRAERHWMFALDGLFPPTPVRHRDLIRSQGLSLSEWPTLAEACAGRGFMCDPDHQGGGGPATPDRRIRKAETDAVATMLLRLHHLAAERRSMDVLVDAWTAIERWIVSARPARPHLMQFVGGVELTAARNRRPAL